MCTKYIKLKISFLIRFPYVALSRYVYYIVGTITYYGI